LSSYKYERLSAQDNDFLQWEKPNLPMHAGATQVFEPGPLATPEGGVDFATIKRGIEGVLHRLPRYRQKLAWVPANDRAVWVDDPHFNLDYHMRHTALPRPGGDDQLKTLAARLLERPLDRSRPLWELWVVEGLTGGRFAIINKTHHCMVDGSSGIDVLTVMMSTKPEMRIAEAPRFVPRPVPSRGELARDEWGRLLGLPLRAAGEITQFVRGDDPAGKVASRLRALGELARWKLVPASETPLNGEVGPHRVVDWFSVPLEDVKAVRRAVGCSVNDVVLGTVTGAAREFLIHRQASPDGLDFRVATPVSVRRESERGRLGNRVSTWILRLPIGAADPLVQLDCIRRDTQALKASKQAAAVDLLEAIHEWIPLDIQSLSAGTQNMFVTNVPGPQFPLYLLGAKLVDIFIHPPLIANLGLVVGVMSYNGRMCWCCMADYDRVPDVADFAALLGRSFERLAAAAGVGVRAAAAGAPAAAASGEAAPPPH
jgi:WS/DGAT/MGAT family acyltransferase